MAGILYDKNHQQRVRMFVELFKKSNDNVQWMTKKHCFASAVNMLTLTFCFSAGRQNNHTLKERNSCD